MNDTKQLAIAVFHPDPDPSLPTRYAFMVNCETDPDEDDDELIARLCRKAGLTANDMTEMHIVSSADDPYKDPPSIEPAEW